MRAVGSFREPHVEATCVRCETRTQIPVSACTLDGEWLEYECAGHIGMTPVLDRQSRTWLAGHGVRPPLCEAEVQAWVDWMSIARVGLADLSQM